MTPTRPNWSKVVGTVSHSTPSIVPGFTNVHVQIGSTEPVEAFPDMVSPYVGTTLPVRVPTEQIDNLITGGAFSAQVRAEGNNIYYADPKTTKFG